MSEDNKLLRKPWTSQLQNEISSLKTQLAEKDKELKLNAAMLARQCDMAREAETKQMKAQAELAALKERIKGIDEVEYNQFAMGCHLEDQGITDRYQAMEFGWRKAMQAIKKAVAGKMLTVRVHHGRIYSGQTENKLLMQE